MELLSKGFATASGSTGNHRERLEVWCLDDVISSALPSMLTLRDGSRTHVRYIAPFELRRALETCRHPNAIAAVILRLDFAHSYCVDCTYLRGDRRFQHTRIFLLPQRGFTQREARPDDDFDIEPALARDPSTRAECCELVEHAVATFRALCGQPQLSEAV